MEIIKLLLALEVIYLLFSADNDKAFWSLIAFMVTCIVLSFLQIK